MKKLNRNVGVVLFLVLVSQGIIKAQTFFKALSNSGNSFHQKIAPLSNGDILIGDSSLEGLRTGVDGKIVLTKLDNCGNVEWSKVYSRDQEYLEFADIMVNDLDEIYIYGSAYQELEELIFLLKLDKDGRELGFRFYSTGTIDHFSYAIDLRNDRLIAYGLILDWNTQKQGFIAVFNENLQFQWGRRFEPFESNGDIILTANGGFLCRSGPFLYRMDDQGNIVWSRRVDTEVSASPIAGPVEVPGGYIFQSYLDNQSFFYKIDEAANVLWKSPLFPSTKNPIDLKPLVDGNLLASYSFVDGGLTNIGYLILTPNGQILEQQRVHSDFDLNVGQTHYALSFDQNLSIVGNKEDNSPGNTDFGAFIMQMPLNPIRDFCMSWESLQRFQEHDHVVNFIPFDTISMDFVMTVVDKGPMLKIEQESPFVEQCNLDENLQRIDEYNLIPCNEDWTVTLPREDLIWMDTGDKASRILSTPGSYKARNRDCEDPWLYEYILEKEPCICEAYLPNAFTPNGDAMNDELKLYSNCQVAKSNIRVFDRWGNLVHESLTGALAWNGLVDGRLLPNGTYLVNASYELVGENGEVQTGVIQQEIVLLH